MQGESFHLIVLHAGNTLVDMIGVGKGIWLSNVYWILRWYGTSPCCDYQYLSFEINNKESDDLKNKINDKLKLLDQIINKLRNVFVYESLTHGNLTLENMLWDYENERVILIDPYAETYCETILGDISQLLQSSVSGYEFISKFIEENDYSIIKYPSDKIPSNLKEFSKKLIENLSEEKWYKEELVKIFHASQFTRMFPFKLVNNPKAGFLFMNHALDLIGSIDVKKI